MARGFDMLGVVFRGPAAGGAFRTLRSCIVTGLVAGAVSGLPACEQEPIDEPRGGGYREDPPENTAENDGKPRAKSALGKAKEAAERLVDEDIAEYNRKLEEAADGKFE